jgi:hypothetical protein
VGRDKAMFWAVVACVMALLGFVDQVFGITDRFVLRESWVENNQTVQRQLSEIREDVKDVKRLQLDILKELRS